MGNGTKKSIFEESLRLYDGEFSFSDRTRPVIAITGNFRNGDCTLAEPYYSSLLAAGAVPIILPPFEDIQGIDLILSRTDGILLSGGADIDPEYMDESPLDCISINPKRDFPEMALIRLAYARRIPMLGICRGIQMLAAALGGELYQDICSQHEGGCINHSQDTERHESSHTVQVKKDTLLHSLLQEETVPVNSFHHQAVKKVPEGFRISAQAPDGIIEAMEHCRFRSILGVQWHPECMHPAGDDRMMPIFNWLVSEARSYGKAKEIHSTGIVLDSHCDTPMFFDRGAHFNIENEAVRVEYDYVGETSPDGSPTFMYTPLVSLRKMECSLQDACFMVAYLKQGARDDESLIAATKKADRLLSLIEERISQCAPAVSLARTPEEIMENRKSGRKSVVLGIENGYAIGKDLNNIRRFAERGVAYITLCHNGDNDLCDSAKGNNEHNGLSELGKSAVCLMNRYGIMADLSHASEKSFYDTVGLSASPVICSHSSARSLCNHPRNLTDDQMRKLAETGGVAQVCLYSGFLKKDGEADITDAVRHIMYMIGIMGIDHVGIGTDFDGGGGIVGLEDSSALLNLTRRLLAEGLGQAELHKIWGENFLNCWKRIRTGRIQD